MRDRDSPARAPVGSSAARATGSVYACAYAVLAAALGLRHLLWGSIGGNLPFITLFGAVAAAVWLGGWPIAAAVATTGYLGTALLFALEGVRPVFPQLGGSVGLFAYLFTCSLIIAIGEAMGRAQARADARGELLRVTLHSIGDAVITTDVAGHIQSMNAVAESLTGWTEAEAVGRPLETVFQIVDEETREPVDNPVTRALRHGVVVGIADHTALIAKKGDEHSIDDSAAPITDARGRVSGCVLVFRDVTVQRRAARERANQLHTARMLASIIESSDDAIIAKSLDGIIQSWNAGAERIFRHTAAHAIGRHISLIVPPDRRAEEEGIIARLAKGERIDHVETERVRADGRRLIVSLTISPIRDETGRVVGASNITRDVTQQREAERRERHLLAEADRRKNEFLAMLAHELRTPLAPITNTARALRLESADRNEMRMASEILERQVGQMSRLVDDLLDMSRITRGRIEIRKSRVTFASIVEQAVEAVRPMCATMQCELTVVLPDEPIYLEADAARLAQVIGNLVHNACKFTNPGGHAELTAERSGDRLVIRVRDDGIGIAPEHLPHLFDMFVQVDTSLERSRGGLGIGLTLAKNLIEMHDGTVEVRSEGLGRGTEVVVTLPILADERPLPQPEPRAEASAEANAGRRVLIVDDNPDSADSLALLLRHSGFETHTTNDGLVALDLAERVRPEAVLLDIGLPGLNGYDVCRRMRSAEWGKDVVLIAMTGWGQDEDRLRSKDAGFDAHLVKPVDYDQLRTLLER